MKISLKDVEVANQVEVGDAIVTEDGHVRIIIKYGFDYCAYSPLTNEILLMRTSIENLLKQYDVKRIIKKNDLELREI